MKPQLYILSPKRFCFNVCALSYPVPSQPNKPQYWLLRVWFCFIFWVRVICSLGWPRTFAKNDIDLQSFCFLPCLDDSMCHHAWLRVLLSVLSVGWLVVQLVVLMEPWLTWDSGYGQVDLELVAVLLPLSMSARIMGLSHHSQLFWNALECQLPAWRKENVK